MISGIYFFVNLCSGKYIHMSCTCSIYVKLVKCEIEECVVPANFKHLFNFIDFYVAVVGRFTW